MRSLPRRARAAVWALPVSLAATSGIDVSFFSSGYLDVSVRRVPSVHLWIQCTVPEGFSGGFPHSDICGSQPVCGSPQLFAAYCVFHRLLVPRHPPCALFCLTFFGMILCSVCVSSHLPPACIFCRRFQVWMDVSWFFLHPSESWFVNIRFSRYSQC